MARKICTDCNTRPVMDSRKLFSGTVEGMFCEPCSDYAGWENTHSDASHDDINDGQVSLSDGWIFDTQAELDEWLAAEREIMTGCPVCHPELDPRDIPAKPVRAGHHNTRPHSWNSHAACTHNRTPKDRAACRKAGGPAGQETRPGHREAG